MTTRLHLVLVAWFALVFGFGIRAARAADEVPPSSLESLEQPPEAPASPPQAPIPPAPVPPPVVEPQAPQPAPQPSPLDQWPIEYVLRPQTLPEGMFELGLRSSVFRPQSGPLTFGECDEALVTSGGSHRCSGLYPGEQGVENGGLSVGGFRSSAHSPPK